ncbi:hypothetical protein FE257_005004 [Aspergillus nanangensis]|uniref:Xylanolytic transcriptional activator regulatory domain-containing protein n=1 Tax=Aspergillus nanangensis TaxID=2582783 RepID=A0AAD4CQZ1_ASPNN|nr:hypothetical protein FE257_005004 [Aspergillus nanangensis]
MSVSPKPTRSTEEIHAIWWTTHESGFYDDSGGSIQRPTTAIRSVPNRHPIVTDCSSRPRQYDLVGIQTASGAPRTAYGAIIRQLDAYYQFIHPCFPILPPSTTSRRSPTCIVDRTSSWFELPYRPRSCLSLAIASILALIPHPLDPEPTSKVSRARRLIYSRVFAQLSILRIDVDCGSGSTTTTTTTTTWPHGEPPFHPDLPVDLEKIDALLILSIYEYIHRGNFVKMQYRAGQALTMALDRGLNCLQEEEDDEERRFVEAKRRTWWMTYYCVLQSYMLGNSLPSIMNEIDLGTPYPHFSADPNGWAVLIETQQALTMTDQFSLDLDRRLRTESQLPFMHPRLNDISHKIHTLLTQSQYMPAGSPDFTTSEYDAALTIRIISRIKLFR